jgi:hypothetical protein
MRKSVVATVTVIVVGLVASLVWQYTHPSPPAFPTDRDLVKLFYAHRQTFETLAHMGGEDATIASRSTDETLSVARRSEYSRLLSQIDSEILLTFDPWRTIKFWCAGAGGAISPSWGKGIAHLTAGPSRVGQIIKTLDKDPGHDDVYLVPIEGDWYVIYQRTDYDNLPQWKSD